jgi:uncharacterized protein
VTVGHAILGLPGDGREGARRTAEVLAESAVDGVKVHQLMVLRRTILERRWKDGHVVTLDADTYLEWLADFVERLEPAQVLHRLHADARPDEKLAPSWDLHASAVRDRLDHILELRATRQGSARSDRTKAVDARPDVRTSAK